MKRIILASMICLMAVAVSAQENKSSKEKVEVTFSVPLDCQNCVNKVEKNIAFEKGVKELECDLEKQTVKVTYREDKNSIEGLKKAFSKIGYPEVKVVQNKQDKETCAGTSCADGGKCQHHHP